MDSPPQAVSCYKRGNPMKGVEADDLLLVIVNEEEVTKKQKTKAEENPEEEEDEPYVSSEPDMSSEEDEPCLSTSEEEEDCNLLLEEEDCTLSSEEKKEVTGTLVLPNDAATWYGEHPSSKTPILLAISWGPAPSWECYSVLDYDHLIRAFPQVCSRSHPFACCGGGGAGWCMILMPHFWMDEDKTLNYFGLWEPMPAREKRKKTPPSRARVHSLSDRRTALSARDAAIKALQATAGTVWSSCLLLSLSLEQQFKQEPDHSSKPVFISRDALSTMLEEPDNALRGGGGD